VPFFNPRAQVWGEHFRIVEGDIRALTPEGRVTVLILRLNVDDRVLERRALIEAGLY